MPLSVIWGEKKSGKTTYVLENLKGRKDSLLIVPEQTLFLYEKKILEELGEENSFIISTLSFKKLSRSLIKNDKEFNRIKLLDKDTKSLVIEKILLTNKDRLSAFKNSAGKPEFAEKIASQISELKKYLITPGVIETLLAGEGIGKALKDKLSDLYFIYSEYEKRIKDIYLDADDLISGAADKVVCEKLYEGKNIYIDGFTGFTGEEIYMIKAFLTNNANVFITLPYLNGRTDSYGDLYYTVKSAYKRLEKMAESLDIKIKEHKLSGDYIKSDEIKYLKDNFGFNNPEVYGKECKNITVSKCRNIKYECVNLCSMIVADIKDNQAKLNEMAVIVPEISSYKGYIEENFSKFGFLYYCNEKKSVYDMPVAMLLNSVFNLILSGNRMDIIMGYLKSGYFFKDNMDVIYKFENFVLKTGIRAYQLMGKPFSEIIEEKKRFNFVFDNETELQEVYERAVLPIIRLKEKILKSDTAKDYSLCLYEFFNDIELESTLKSYVKDYEDAGDLINGDRLIQVYNYILESIERTTLVLSDFNVSFSEYKDIIILSLKNKNISSVPVLMDSILLTQPESFNNDSYKYIYVLGANEGKLPSSGTGSAVINEEERELLLSSGIELSMTQELKIMENNLKIFDILTSPEKKLCISYCMYTSGGEEVYASDFVGDIIEMFDLTPLNENRDALSKRELLKTVMADISKNKVISDEKILKYLLMEEKYVKVLREALYGFGKPPRNYVKISDKNIKKLFGDSLNLSVTNMEKYRSCAFSYFIRYVLRAKEKEEYTINFANMGSLMHLILEEFSSGLKADGMDFSMVDSEYIENKLDKIVSKTVMKIDNGVFVTDKKATFLVRRLTSLAIKTINLIKLHFTKGIFEAVDFELSFGRSDSKVNGLTFDIGDGRKIVLNGVIDRVDKLSSDSGDYIRIVDYKSTGKTIDFYEVFYGIKIQLAVYLMTMLSQSTVDRIKPGGMLYLSLDAPVILVKSPAELDRVEAEVKKKLVMTGFYLNNLDVLDAMDNEFIENSKSEIIDVELDRTGLLKGKNTLTLDEFRVMLDTVSENIRKEGQKIFDGDFSVNPIKNSGTTSCDYCPYKSICMFDTETSEIVSISKTPKKELFLKECEDNE